jgi:hypothetical protein
LKVERSWLTILNHPTQPSQPDTSFPTARIAANLRARWPWVLQPRNRIRYNDQNWPRRAGWKEIVVLADKGVTLVASSVPSTDLSLELTTFPADPSVVTPQNVNAEIEFVFEDRPTTRLMLYSAAALALAALAIIGRRPLAAFVRARRG